MKIFPILSAALACGLIASSCAVKNMSLSRPVSSVPSDISSAIPAAGSEPTVSSIAAISSAISSVADKTPSVAVSSKAASTAGKRVAASRVLKNSSFSNSMSVTYDSVSAVPLPEGLIDGMKNPENLMLSGFAACLYSVPPKNEDKTAAKVQSMLTNAVPYSGMIPRLNGHCSFNGYIGPCFLTAQTHDGHKVQIKPYVYVPDLLVITVDNKMSYFTAHDLYTWLQSKQCVSDFDLDYHQIISVPVTPYKGK